MELGQEVGSWPRAVVGRRTERKGHNLVVFCSAVARTIISGYVLQGLAHWTKDPTFLVLGFMQGVCESLSGV